jgi:hypothetical protein
MRLRVPVKNLLEKKRRALAHCFKLLIGRYLRFRKNLRKGCQKRSWFPHFQSRWNDKQTGFNTGYLELSMEDAAMRFLTKWARPQTSRPTDLRCRPKLEGLENRVVPYVATGNLWPHPQLVTISFMPDGTNLGGVTSNLFSSFNGRFGSASAWQTPILKAAQVWAQYTNLNFAVISDSGAAEGSGSYQQGASSMGDIRIGGYNFGTSQLASAYLPPAVDNYSVAGDIQFNTGQAFNINGQTYDLFTVAMHEIGHALGLDHSTATGAVMSATYNGTMTGLGSDDISGIQSIYSRGGARTPDQFGSTNGSFATSASLTGQINGNNLTALVTNLDITTAGEKDYYGVVAPSGTGSTVNIAVQSSGLSQLAPTVTVYAANQSTILGFASGAGHDGTTLTLNLTNKIAAGAQFYIKVAGADSSAFGTGEYAVTMSFAGNPLPSVPLPNTQVANGTPLTAGGGLALVEAGQTTGHGTSDLLSKPSHGSGCNCPFCSGAAAAVQQTQRVLTGLAHVQADAALVQVSMPTGHVTPTLLTVTPGLGESADSAGSSGSILGVAAPARQVPPVREVPSSDAFFAGEGWLNDLDPGFGLPV